MSDFFSNVVQGAQNLSWAEMGATIFGLIYIVLVVKENPWCWFWGILSSALLAWVTYTSNGYYIDAVLNIFYVVMGFLGIYQWRFGGRNKDELPVTQLTVNQHVMIIIVGIGLTVLFGYLFKEYTSAERTYLDAFTTAFAIFATFMTIQKKLGNWIYWIVVDLLYVYMYALGGTYLLMLLYIIYCFIAIKGYLDWRKLVVREYHVT